jgi:hypothetical protein
VRLVNGCPWVSKPMEVEVIATLLGDADGLCPSVADDESLSEYVTVLVKIISLVLTEITGSLPFFVVLDKVGEGDLSSLKADRLVSQKQKCKLFKHTISDSLSYSQNPFFRCCSDYLLP